MSIRTGTVVDWPRRCAELEARQDALAPAELDEWGQALWFIGREDDSARAWERAHLAFLAADELTDAVRCAFWLGFTLGERGNTVRARTWMRRLVELCADAPESSALAATGALCRGVTAFAAGDAAASIPHLRDARQAAARAGDADLAVLAAMNLGRSLVQAGAFGEGFELLDQVMLMIGAGQASDRAAGPAYCAVIASLLARWDLERAQVWTRELGEWCDAQQGLVPFRGECTLHRALVMQIGGEWEAAAAGARLVCETDTDRGTLGGAWYLAGELHRLQGRRVEAENAYRRGSEFGRDPQPGLALLRWDAGDIAAARAGLARALLQPRPPAACADLHAAAVRVGLADRDVSSAQESVVALEQTAATFGTGYLEALAVSARGELDLAAGRTAAVSTLRRAWTLWQSVGAPHEAARMRVALGAGYRELGDDEGARLEFDAARREFERLGAVPELARLERSAATAAPDGGLSPREIEVVGLIARGWSNRRIAEHLFLSERTVDRHVSNILAKVGAGNRAGATAFAFAHGLATAT